MEEAKALTKLALIASKPSKTNFKQYFEGLEFDYYTLSSNPNLKKILKADVDIDIEVGLYDYIILVGAEPVRHFLGAGKSVMDYTGTLLEDKFIPCINPAMLMFKPEVTKDWEKSLAEIKAIAAGTSTKLRANTADIRGIQDYDEALAYVQYCIDAPSKYVAIDSETGGLYPRKGGVLGVSLSCAKNEGAYIDAEIIDEFLEIKFQELFDKKIMVFHNAKFDIAFFKYHFGWTFPRFEDTMLLHYCLDENPGTHGLKQLAVKYTEYGDYEAPLHEFIADYRKRHGILKDAFTWDVIPFETMWPYAATDSLVTYLLFIQFKAAVVKNPQLNSVYNDILIPGVKFVIKMEDNGVPFDRDRIAQGRKIMQYQIDEAEKELMQVPEIRTFIADNGSFNPNSPQQLRKLLFDYLKLTPTGKRTGTGALSTDAEVLTELAEQSEIPARILQIRKAGKIKNTYLDKIQTQLDRDSRLRTGFNIHGTTSGRLSSSGTLNMQQLPRDNPAVKGAIKARPGYKIVSLDLTTAEVYCAAVLSGDKALQSVFTSGEDFHSTIAKMVFNLPCPVGEVKTKHKLLRQAAKAIKLVASKSL